MRKRERERESAKMSEKGENGNISHYVPCKNAESCHSHKFVCFVCPDKIIIVDSEKTSVVIQHHLLFLH